MRTPLRVLSTSPKTSSKTKVSAHSTRVSLRVYSVLLRARPSSSPYVYSVLPRRLSGRELIPGIRARQARYRPRQGLLYRRRPGGPVRINQHTRIFAYFSLSAVCIVPSVPKSKIQVLLLIQSLIVSSISLGHMVIRSSAMHGFESPRPPPRSPSSLYITLNSLLPALTGPLLGMDARLLVNPTPVQLSLTQTDIARQYCIYRHCMP